MTAKRWVLRTYGTSGTDMYEERDSDPQVFERYVLHSDYADLEERCRALEAATAETNKVCARQAVALEQENWKRVKLEADRAELIAALRNEIREIEAPEDGGPERALALVQPQTVDLLLRLNVLEKVDGRLKWPISELGGTLGVSRICWRCWESAGPPGFLDEAHAQGAAAERARIEGIVQEVHDEIKNSYSDIARGCCMRILRRIRAGEGET